jgi:hypothetical protein
MVAALFLAATVFVGLLLMRELRATPAGVPAPAAAPTAAPAVPERAISVPALLLSDGGQVRVGDTAERVRGVVGPAESAAPVVEPGPLGERAIRTYDHHGTRFLLVFEPFELKGPPRVAGIYLQ